MEESRTKIRHLDLSLPCYVFCFWHLYVDIQQAEYQNENKAFRQQTFQYRCRLPCYVFCTWYLYVDIQQVEYQKENKAFRQRTPFTYHGKSLYIYSLHKWFFEHDWRHSLFPREAGYDHTAYARYAHYTRYNDTRHTRYDHTPTLTTQCKRVQITRNTADTASTIACELRWKRILWRGTI